MSLPKVSCIMPTCYGDKYFVDAMDCFGSQDYLGEMELVMVDNNEPANDELRLASNVFGFKYLRTTRKPVGALRNEGIRVATGEVIVIWDEDDWSGSTRITDQVSRLLLTGKQVTGWHNVLYWDEATGGTYKYLFEARVGGNHPPYAMGASQCFYKSWWEKHPYIEQGAEDKAFSDEAMHRNELDSVDAGKLYVARFHGSNVGGTNRSYFGSHKQFPAVERSEFPQEFFEVVAKTASEERELTNGK